MAQQSTKGQQQIDEAVAAFDRLPDESFVRGSVVDRVFSISTATRWRWARAGILPAAEKIGPNVTAWRVGKLRAAMAKMGEAA